MAEEWRRGELAGAPSGKPPVSNCAWSRAEGYVCTTGAGERERATARGDASRAEERGEIEAFPNYQSREMLSKMENKRVELMRNDAPLMPPAPLHEVVKVCFPFQSIYKLKKLADRGLSLIDGVSQCDGAADVVRRTHCTHDEWSV